MRTIDLNVDAGEDPARLADGREEALLRLVTSVNIACVGHAGDEDSVHAMVALAFDVGVEVVAHPSYPDRAGFGRERLSIDAEALRASLAGQVALVRSHAPACGTVKPDGALYHDVAADPSIARTLAEACAGMRVVLPPTLRTRGVVEEHGCAVCLEGFADRAVRTDGTLVPRSEAGALITDPDEAAVRALTLAHEGVVDTICVHSDTPNALMIAGRVREALEGGGFVLSAG